MTPREAYASHKSRAKQRGVDFDLTFEEWWAIWAPRWEQRGRGHDGAQMCRTRDEGGYSADNVRIDTQRANAAERGVASRAARAAAAFRSPGRTSAKAGGLDWCWRRDVFAPYVEDDDA